MVRLLPPEKDIGVLHAPIRSSFALFAAFLVVLLGVGLLDRIGFAPGFAPFAIVVAAFVLFVLAALNAHSRRAADFYVADRRVGPAFSGIAAAGTFVGIATIGLLSGAIRSTADFLVVAAGLATGFLVLGLVIAPGLRGFGAYTAGDFIAHRFRGAVTRLLWAAITFTVSFLILLAHLKLAAPLTATLTGLTPEHALYATAALTAMAALPGGMRSLTWTQGIQYFLIVIACLVPAGYLASGEASQAMTAGELGALLTANLPSWRESGTTGFALPFLLGALGAAALPQLSARPLTAASTREAATSLIWGVFFAIVAVLIGLVLVDLLAQALGGQVEAGEGLQQIAALFSALPGFLAGLLLAGALAALFAIGQAALFAASSALSHDVWDEILDRKGAEGRRIVIARILVIAVAGLGVALAQRWDADPAALVRWALAMAAAGSLVPLLLGLWWRRCNEIGAMGGMVAGFGFSLLVFLLGQHIIPEALVTSGWTGVGAPTAAVAGTLMSLAVTVGLSLATPAPETDPDEADNDDRRGGLPVRERPA